jgi:multicomponent Na+:H+ antiporter subunit B
MRGMSLIVKTVTRLVAEFITIFAVYIVLFGHLTPGGGFTGGVILSCSFILLTLAFGKEFSLHVLSKRATGTWDSIGALAFLLLALIGYRAGAFFYNLWAEPADYTLISAGTIFWFNLAIGIKVGAAVFGGFMALAVFRRHGPGGYEEDE